jgi:hypothetical protein
MSYRKSFKRKGFKFRSKPKRKNYYVVDRGGIRL